MKYGYMRVSTDEQNLKRQELELVKLGVDKIIKDKATGKNININLNNLLEFLNEDDELIVLSLDRLGRSLENNISILNELKEKGIKFTSIKENLIIDKNNTPMNDFIFSIFSSVSELERSLIKERQKEGIIARKKEKGKAYNKQSIKRTKRLKNKAFRNDIKHRNKDYVMNKWNISRSTYYNYRKITINSRLKYDIM